MIHGLQQYLCQIKFNLFLRNIKKRKAKVICRCIPILEGEKERASPLQASFLCAHSSSSCVLSLEIEEALFDYKYI